MLKVFSVIILSLFIALSAAHAESVFDKIYNSPDKVEDGVRYISYGQLLELKASGEKFRMFDVLQEASYNKGHIPEAESFPVFLINKDSAANKLSKSDNVVVYCGNFKCHASSKAAKTLQDLGYRVVDYKGGLKEWREMGNKLLR